jgi:D-arabinose 1-dehydrogenase-like Zn-dependent alcohol dehydrogenase
MSATASQTLPTTCRALVFHGIGEPLTVETVPVPSALPGSAVVKILAAGVDPSTARILAGHAPGFTFPVPFIPGTKAVGRIAALGPDAVALKLGQLVLIEPFVRARDDPNTQILFGAYEGPTPASKKLFGDNWRNGTYSEYTRAPLENVYALDEKLLGDPSDGGFGYTAHELTAITRHLVAYGGLRGINLQAGETIVIAPATGAFSGAAVEVASAMGARVIAMGRNVSVLKRLATHNPRVHTVELKNNPAVDMAALADLGPIDAYLDLSPVMANGSTHIRSCLLSLKQYGRASLMGVVTDDIALPYAAAVWNNLTIRGQYMYEREDVFKMIKMIETGVLKMGKDVGQEVVGYFPLEDWDAAMKCAGDNAAAGQVVVLTP